MIVFVLLVIFVGPDFAPLGMVMELFGDNAYGLIGMIFVLFFAALVCNIIYTCLAFAKRQDAKELLTVNMVVKCIQIPAYILIFLMGIMCLMTIFTMGFSVLLMVLDCLGLVLTGLLAVSGIIRAALEGKITKKTAVFCCIGSFIFCVDVVIAIVLYRKVKKWR